MGLSYLFAFPGNIPFLLISFGSFWYIDLLIRAPIAKQRGPSLLYFQGVFQLVFQAYLQLHLAFSLFLKGLEMSEVALFYSSIAAYRITSLMFPASLFGQSSGHIPRMRRVYFCKETPLPRVGIGCVPKIPHQMRTFRRFEGFPHRKASVTAAGQVAAGSQLRASSIEICVRYAERRTASSAHGSPARPPFSREAG